MIYTENTPINIQETNNSTAIYIPLNDDNVVSIDVKKKKITVNPIKGRVIDLGAGVGTLSIIIARKNNRIKIDSIEKDFNTY